MRGDAIVDEVRRVRDELVKRHGGLDGWIEHLQAMDRERARQVKRQRLKKPASAGGKRPRRLSMPRRGGR
jgi:hypothetical protein